MKKFLAYLFIGWAMAHADVSFAQALQEIGRYADDFRGSEIVYDMQFSTARTVCEGKTAPEYPTYLNWDRSAGKALNRRMSVYLDMGEEEPTGRLLIPNLGSFFQRFSNLPHSGIAFVERTDAISLDGGKHTIHGFLVGKSKAAAFQQILGIEYAIEGVAYGRFLDIRMSVTDSNNCKNIVDAHGELPVDANGFLKISGVTSYERYFPRIENAVPNPCPANPFLVQHTRKINDYLFWDLANNINNAESVDQLPKFTGLLRVNRDARTQGLGTTDLMEIKRWKKVPKYLGGQDVLTDFFSISGLLTSYGRQDAASGRDARGEMNLSSKGMYETINGQTYIVLPERGKKTVGGKIYFNRIRLYDYKELDGYPGCIRAVYYRGQISQGG